MGYTRTKEGNTAINGSRATRPSMVKSVSLKTQARKGIISLVILEY